MTASSQTPPGALPPEMPSTGAPPPEAVRAAYAAYGVAIPAPAGPPAPQPPPAEEAPAVTTLQAAAAVLSKEMDESDGSRTPRDLAAAEERAGILFDAAHVEAVRTAALDQARAEYAAELAETRRQLALIAGSRRQVEAVLRLCEGRRGDDLLLVSAVAVAAECGTTALDDLPMALQWSGSANDVHVNATRARAIVKCTSSYGGRAHLVIDGKDRTALASLLDLQVRDIHATCTTEGCGTVDDYDASDPAMSGWSRLQIAALGDEPRWYCSDMCVFDALTRAGHELAAEDRAAAVDPGEQGPQLPDHLVDEAAVADDVARCVRCGCTEVQACEGGCHWIPNRDMVNLCSACATPTEMVYAAGAPR